MPFPDGRAEDVELGQEARRGREPGQGEEEDRQGGREPGIAPAQPGEIVESVCSMPLPVTAARTPKAPAFMNR